MRDAAPGNWPFSSPWRIERSLGLNSSSIRYTKLLASKGRFDLRNVSFAQMNLFDIGLREKAFDFVFGNEVLHHTADACGRGILSHHRSRSKSSILTANICPHTERK